MSRAFVKEDTSEPPLVMPRAPLPEGVPNYVTRRGLQLLRAERMSLEGARPDFEAPDLAGALAAHNARLNALDARLASAVVIEPGSLPRDEVRFSAKVTLRHDTGQERRYRIVGVDEANPEAGQIAFTAPLALRLSGLCVGDLVSLRSAGDSSSGELDFAITSIDYTQE